MGHRATTEPITGARGLRYYDWLGLGLTTPLGPPEPDVKEEQLLKGESVLLPWANGADAKKKWGRGAEFLLYQKE